MKYLFFILGYCLGFASIYADVIKSNTTFTVNTYDGKIEDSHTLAITDADHLLVTISGDTEIDYDILTITSENQISQTFSGAIAKRYIVEGSSVHVHFLSDETTGTDGFIVEIHEVSVPQILPDDIVGIWKNNQTSVYLKIQEDRHVFAYYWEESADSCQTSYWGALEENQIHFQDTDKATEQTRFLKQGDFLIENYHYESWQYSRQEVFLYTRQDQLPWRCSGQTTVPKSTLEMTHAGWHLGQVGNVSDLDQLFKQQPGVVSIWGWDSKLETWRVKFRTPPDNNPFELLEELHANVGYWFRTQVYAKVSGTIGKTVADFDNLNLEKTTNWHLVGTENDLDVVRFFSGKLSPKGSVWSWSDQKWQVYVPGDEGEVNQFNLSHGTTFGNLRKLKKNQGFWIQYDDGRAPSIVRTTPNHQSTQVDPREPLVITVDTPLDPTTIQSNLSVKARTGSSSQEAKEVSGNISYHNRQISFDTVFLSNTEYEVTLTRGIKDINGNTLTGETVINFKTGNPPDRESPTVLFQNPSPFFKDWPLSAPLSVVFNETIDSSTITPETFLVRNSTGFVSGMFQFEANTVTFHPSTTLTPNTSYSMTLMEDIKDVSGNSLAIHDAAPQPPGIYHWTFSTGTRLAGQAPNILSITPTSFAEAVPSISQIKVLFDTELDESSINENTFVITKKITDGSENNEAIPVEGSVAYANQTAVFTPSTNFEGNQEYTVTLKAEIQAVTGNALETPFFWSFTTNPGDPYFKYQWHLLNTGQSVYSNSSGTAGEDANLHQPIAEGFTGEGVVITVVDRGVEQNHEDLVDNINPDFITDLRIKNNKSDATSLSPFADEHGTSVAGIIAATANNGKGGRGVAPKATLGIINFLVVPETDANFYEAFGGASSTKTTDIFNLSLGFNAIDDEKIVLNANRETHLKMMLLDEDESLREGKGAIFVKASGNGFETFEASDVVTCPLGSNRYCHCNLANLVSINCQNANMDYLNSTPWMIVVGALNAKGERASYSTPGSSLWISAHGGEPGNTGPGILTTDLQGCDKGYSTSNSANAFDKNSTNENQNCKYISSFSGTSSATPLVSGAIALILEANPDLTWRDVKHVLATTAKQVDADQSGVSFSFGEQEEHGEQEEMESYKIEQGWIKNNAGHFFHNWYGFGKMDVHAAIQEAQNYNTSLGEFEISPWIPATTPIPNHYIPFYDVEGKTDTISVTLDQLTNGKDLVIEAVQIKLNVTHPATGRLGVELISPAGTKSILLNFQSGFYNTPNFENFVLLSNAFYFEKAQGNWTLRVFDGGRDLNNSLSKRGTLDSWEIRFFGHHSF